METCQVCHDKGTVDIRIDKELDYHGVATMPCPLCKLGMVLEKSLYQESLDFAKQMASKGDFSTLPEHLKNGSIDDKTEVLWGIKQKELRQAGHNVVARFVKQEEQTSKRDYLSHSARYFAGIDKLDITDNGYELKVFIPRPIYIEPRAYDELIEIITKSNHSNLDNLSLIVTEFITRALDSGLASKHKRHANDGIYVPIICVKSNKKFDIRQLEIKTNFDTATGTIAITSNIRTYCNEYRLDLVRKELSNALGAFLDVKTADSLKRSIGQIILSGYVRGEVAINSNELKPGMVLLFSGDLP